MRPSAASGASVITDLPDRIRAELKRKGYLGAILSSERHALTESLADDHREIGAMFIPTLAIWGEADEVIPISGVGQLAIWNRQAHQEVIPGAIVRLGSGGGDRSRYPLHSSRFDVDERCLVFGTQIMALAAARAAGVAE